MANDKALKASIVIDWLSLGAINSYSMAIGLAYVRIFDFDMGK